MADSLSTLVQDLKSSCQAMPERLQHALSDGQAAQQNLESVRAQASAVSASLEQARQQSTAQLAQFEDKLKQSTAAALSFNQQSGDRLQTLQAQVAKSSAALGQEQAGAEQACAALLERSTSLRDSLQTDLDSHRSKTTEECGKIREAHNQLLASHRGLMEDFSHLSQALTASGKLVTGAVNHLLTSLQQASAQVSEHGENLKAGSLRAAASLGSQLQTTQKETVEKPVLTRVSHYSQATTQLHTSGQRTLLDVNTSLENHDSQVAQASTSLSNNQGAYESHANGQVPATSKAMEDQRGDMQKAQDKLGLNDDGTKKNLLQQAYDVTVGKLASAVQAFWQDHGAQVMGAIYATVGFAACAILAAIPVANFALPEAIALSVSIAMTANGVYMLNNNKPPSADGFMLQVGTGIGPGRPTGVEVAGSAGAFNFDVKVPTGGADAGAGSTGGSGPGEGSAAGGGGAAPKVNLAQDEQVASDKAVANIEDTPVGRVPKQVTLSDGTVAPVTNGHFVGVGGVLYDISPDHVITPSANQLVAMIPKVTPIQPVGIFMKPKTPVDEQTTKMLYEIYTKRPGYVSTPEAFQQFLQHVQDGDASATKAYNEMIVEARGTSTAFGMDASSAVSKIVAPEAPQMEAAITRAAANKVIEGNVSTASFMSKLSNGSLTKDSFERVLKTMLVGETSESLGVAMTDKVMVARVGQKVVGKFVPGVGWALAAEDIAAGAKITFEVIKEAGVASKPLWDLSQYFL